MPAVTTYLNFNDNCEEAFNFYKAAFGTEFTTVMRFGDVTSEYPSAPEEAKKIMHIALPIGKGTSLMGSDSPSPLGGVVIGTNISVAISPDTEAEADKLFQQLSDGGKVTMPLDKVFWGAYFGMFTYKYGVNWMVNYEYPQ